ncbi:hypothetical protein ASG45_06970 [Microbacterium sp. Leaf436]|nr:hypothetical protein ASG45_06970 [Microbacterium sp. Leaf436]
MFAVITFVSDPMMRFVLNVMPPRTAAANVPMSTHTCGSVTSGIPSIRAEGIQTVSIPWG